MEKDKLHQYKLGRKTIAGNPEYTVCWLDAGLQPGWIVTFKDDPEKEEWIVVEKWSSYPRLKSEVDKKWHVGGL